MATARIFIVQNCQAVRLPNEFRFHASEIEVFRDGDEVILREKAKRRKRLPQKLRRRSSPNSPALS
jgi:antitoxin VapB